MKMNIRVASMIIPTKSGCGACHVPLTIICPVICFISRIAHPTVIQTSMPILISRKSLKKVTTVRIYSIGDRRLMETGLC